MANNDGSGRRLLKDKEVLRTLSIGRTTLWAWRKKGIIPQPRVINGRNYTLSDQLDACLSNLPTLKLKPAGARTPDVTTAGKKAPPASTGGKIGEVCDEAEHTQN